MIDTYNQLLAEVDRSITGTYFSRVGEQVPPVEKMEPIRLMTLSGPWDKTLEEATASLAAARQDASDLAVIADAEGMIARAKDLGEAYRAAAKYYASAAYKDDHGDGAKALHERFLHAFDAYQDARHAVAVALEANEQKELRQELAKFPATSMSHRFRKALLAAKVLLGARRAQDLPAAFADANAKFQAEVQAFDTFAATKSDAPLAWKNFQRAFSDIFATHVAKLTRELADPKTPPAQVDADLELLTSYYNGLVQATNALLQVEDQLK